MRRSTLRCCALVALEILIRVKVCGGATLCESERISIILQLQLEVVGHLQYKLRLCYPLVAYYRVHLPASRWG